MTISHTDPRELLPSDDGLGPIVQIGPDRLEEAIERLTASGSATNSGGGGDSGGGGGDPDHARRFIVFASEQHIDLTWLFCRLNDQGRIMLTALFVPSPGRTCMAFASTPPVRSQIQSLGGVLDHGCRELAVTSLDLAQALLEPAEVRLRDAFTEAGFDALATLSYLERPLPTRRSRLDVHWPHGVTVEPFDETLVDELIGVLDATYEQTMDCPGLFGLRRTEDILAGHKASGEFDPALWTLLRIDGVAFGTILLNPAPASRAVELVYMGLAPSARGRGLGVHLLNHGLSLLTGRTEHNVTLAVDEHNAPALALYHRAGFRPVLRRRAMIRSL